MTDQLFIPLLWKALPKKGNSNSQEQPNLLKTFIDIFGAERIRARTADRGLESHTY